MFKNTILFALLITAVYGSAFANIPSTAYVEDYVANEIGKLPAQQVVNNATLTIQKNGTSVGTFTANQSTNKTINITVPTGALASKNAVTTSEITDGTIMNADIATNAAIAASKISGLATVATSGSYNDLSNKPTLGALASKDAVTTSEITDGTITNADIATNAAIAASKISGLARVATSGSYDDLSNKPTLGALASKGSVTTSEITDGTIATADIADSAITTAKIAASAVTSAKIADGTIATADIADSAITTAKIAVSAVTSAKIADATITNADIATNAAIATSKISGLARVATSGSYNDLSNKPSIPSAYTLPPATTTGLGGVKIGGNIDVTDDGTVSVKTGSPSKLGVVKVGQIPSGSATSTTYATIWVE